ncbi:DUF192 domain-containing protein [Candidatus Gottesmanbacteria bacterium]|nr:DUF192 domain-containing protein [Candidatus Gottesmanbacteria bacterium]
MKPWLLVLIILPFLTLLLYYRSHPLVSKVKIRDTVIVTEVAVTEAQKQKGLGGRKILGNSSGMLFPYDHKEHYNFWMRGMLFPLDFIWIDGNRIADITLNVPPPVGDQQPAMIKPKVPVDKVLEVNAGFVREHQITIGDMVQFMDK